MRKSGQRLVMLLILAGVLAFALIRETKGVGSLFGLLNGVEMETVLDERFELEGVTHLTVNAQVLNVEIAHAQDDRVRVVLKSNLPQEHRAELAVERDGQAFKIEQLRRMRIGIFLGAREKLTVYLPADYDQALALKLTSGNLEMPGARVLSHFKLSVTSGNIKCGDITAPEYTIKSTSGKITAGALVGEGSLQLTSGGLQITALHGERIAVNTTSGTVRVGEVDGELDLNVTSGTVNIDNFNGRGKISSASGNIHVGIRGMTGDMWLHCTSGTIKATVPENSAFRFDGKVTSGTIKTDFPSSKDGGHTTAQVGAAAEHALRCDTMSGTIRVSYL